jgi:hypothetical protein
VVTGFVKDQDLGVPNSGVELFVEIHGMAVSLGRVTSGAAGDFSIVVPASSSP